MSLRSKIDWLVLSEQQKPIDIHSVAFEFHKDKAKEHKPSSIEFIDHMLAAKAHKNAMRSLLTMDKNSYDLSKRALNMSKSLGKKF